MWGFKNKIMDWINVKENHFADIKQNKNDNGYSWESDMIDEQFLVAVPTNKGWDIEKVVLIDEIGLQTYVDNEENEPYEWDMRDITHWIKIKPPYKL